MKILMLADDLTGAMDSGVQLAKRGIATCVLLDDKLQGELPNCQLLVIDLESRHKKPEEAAAQMKPVLEQLQGRYDYLYVKTDSVLRGNLSAAFHQVREQLGSSIVFVPFFPDNKRATRDGIQYVNGVPIQESSFGKDPLNPIQTGSVEAILNEACENRVVLVKAGNAFPWEELEKNKVIILEGENQADLEHWTAELKREAVPGVLAGCAGFASCLPELTGLKDGHISWQQPEGPALILCGSANETSFRQLAVARANGALILPLQPGSDIKKLIMEVKEQLAQGQSVIVATACRREEVKMEAGYHEQLQNQWRLLAAGIREAGCSRLGIVGGDTCQAVLSELGITRLRPVDELQPGLPVSRMELAGREVLLMTKSGGLGDESAIIQMTGA